MKSKVAELMKNPDSFCSGKGRNADSANEIYNLLEAFIAESKGLKKVV